ncbi:alpha/beta fold hydrolase [Variovorax sp. J22R24]|uniref:alpha/beta fold hydrolase n=1 Tax=Variovorax gracilis TaxID=3053502 RepID=UPI002578420D|nr:alpha/beta fold hydrolase [Variovorax sp. J22R24]MDM0106541.1 alpha/beta fold hydrolase [Variovorax sp. J22R24]
MATTSSAVDKAPLKKKAAMPKPASPPARKRASAKAGAQTPPKDAPPTAAKPARRPARTTPDPTTVVNELSDLVARASENTLAPNPLIGLRASDFAEAAQSLLKLTAVSPGATIGSLAKYAKSLGQIVQGRSELAPDPKDRRFADPAWQGNFAYKRLMQNYLLAHNEFNSLIAGSKLGEREKGQAQFLTALVTDALAPSNWLIGNPAAVRKVVDTGGASLVKGVKNLVSDMRHNHMMPMQVDSTPFKIGENMAASAGQVVYRCETFELIQYTPSTPKVYQRPLVMVPPQVNKFYAVDLAPEKSLVKWTVDSGVQMFMISWRNPTAEHRDWGLEHYAMAVNEAVDVARQVTGSPDVNMWGSCSGGMTLAAYLGYLAGIGDTKVANVSWAVCVLDGARAMDDTTLGLFNSPAAVRAARARSRNKGVVEGSEMATMFAWLRPNDLIWNYWVNNYLLGNKPPAFDILAWNADTTRLPARFHSDLLDIIEKNPYVKAGSMTIRGVPIDMSKVDIGAYVIGGITDHITPWKSCYATARVFGDDATFVLANAGHLQSLINPPGAPKAYFSTAPSRQADPEEWTRAAVRQEGSWWPHWRAWMQERSGSQVEAPRKPGSRTHRALCAAPGEYVLER